MKAIYLIIVILTCYTLTNSAQIQPESVDWDTPQIGSSFLPSDSDSGPLWIVKTDSLKYRLDSPSTKRIDTDWIRSISVFKDGKATVMYGGSGKNGVIIITLKEDHIDDFLEGTKPDNALKIRKVD